MKSLLLCLILVAGAKATHLDSSTRALNSSNCTLYTLQTQDTCVSIGKTTGATYAQLLSWNPDINPLCSNLGNLTSNTICVSNPLGSYALSSNTVGVTSIATTAAPVPAPTPDQTNGYCGAYDMVAEGQDCSIFTTKYGITLQDFLFLNPEVWTNCTNLWPDYYYCVEPVGYISTYPGYGGSPTTLPFNQTASTPLPNAGDPLANFTSTYPVIPIANLTRLDCYSYFWTDNITDNDAADCWGLAMASDITAEEFILWNPSLAENNTSEAPTATATAKATTTNPYVFPCTISASFSYCIALASPTPDAEENIVPPSPRAAGEIANCTMWYAPQSYDTCADILGLYYLTIEEFYTMNPSVKSDCTGMATGTYYCLSTYPGGVPPSEPYDPSGTITSTTAGTTSGTPTGTSISTPSPIQTGMISTCDLFYKVITNDSCYNIAQTYHIALADFYAWNSAVKTDCTGLQANEYVCVGILPSTTTATATATTTTTTATGVVTPTPTQSGMVGDCTKFYFVKSGDGCQAVADTQGISLSDFYVWNPAVKTDCSGLQANVYVCVGLATSKSAVSPAEKIAPIKTPSASKLPDAVERIGGFIR